MSREKTTKKSKTQEEKKPRYIENLIKTANKRKLENERRIERQVFIIYEWNIFIYLDVCIIIE